MELQMHRHELTDAQFEWLQQYLPANGGRGGQWRDHRQVLNGIFWHLRTGSPWRDLPERYGPWQTVYERFNRWRKDGTWDRILQALQVYLDRQGRLDWNLWHIDATTVRAHRCAAGAGKKGAPTSRKTMGWAAQEEVTPPRSTCSARTTARRWARSSARAKATRRSRSW
jgi:transposase